MSSPRAAYSYDYSRIETVISGFVPDWRLMDFDAVVAIARGALTPGVMVSTSLDVPLHALAYARATRQVSWYTVDRPGPNSRILLVEDIAGRGTTLSDSADYLRKQGHDISIFTLAYDSESRIKPDYGVKIPSGFRAWFPWERESITPSFDITLNCPERPGFDYASWAIDLDGVLLMDLPEHDYAQSLRETLARRDVLLPSTSLPQLDLGTITIITGRPEQDRERTQCWLDRHGFHGALIMRDEARHTPEQSAAHKAEAILARCHTHFVESDPRQALAIASLAPVARVVWWDGCKALMVYANAIEQLDMA